MDHRLPVTEHPDVVGAAAQERTRVYHFETLVHEGRRVNGDLRSHAPRRMGERLVERHRGEIGALATPERSPAGGEHDSGELTDRARARTQALMERAVLGVDRQ